MRAKEAAVKKKLAPRYSQVLRKAELEGIEMAPSSVENIYETVRLQKLEDIFNDDYGIWNVGLSLTAPIFNGGRLRAAAKLQESVKDKSKDDLLNGLLNAFSEVEQLLELEESLVTQQISINSAVKQSLDAYNLSKERYDKGVTILESVLNTQRQYNNIKSQYLSLSRQRIDNRLSLLLALGGNSN